MQTWNCINVCECWNTLIEHEIIWTYWCIFKTKRCSKGRSRVIMLRIRISSYFSVILILIIFGSLFFRSHHWPSHNCQPFTNSRVLSISVVKSTDLITVLRNVWDWPGEGQVNIDHGPSHHAHWTSEAVGQLEKLRESGQQARWRIYRIRLELCGLRNFFLLSQYSLAHVCIGLRISNSKLCKVHQRSINCLLIPNIWKEWKYQLYSTNTLNSLWIFS